MFDNINFIETRKNATVFQNALLYNILRVTFSQNAHKIFTFERFIVIVALSKGIATGQKEDFKYGKERYL